MSMEKPSDRINAIIAELQAKHGVELTAGVICTAIIAYLDEAHRLKELVAPLNGRP